MSDDRVAIVYVTLDVKMLNIPYVAGTTAEDLCTKVNNIITIYLSLQNNFFYRK